MVEVRLTIETAAFPDPADDERVVYADLERTAALAAAQRVGEWVDITPRGWLERITRPIESVTHDAANGAITCHVGKFVDGDGGFVDRARASGWQVVWTSEV
jgi:hypothetical protein